VSFIDWVCTKQRQLIQASGDDPDVGGYEGDRAKLIPWGVAREMINACTRIKASAGLVEQKLLDRMDSKLNSEPFGHKFFFNLLCDPRTLPGIDDATEFVKLYLQKIPK
jgi:hypothetical protein